MIALTAFDSDSAATSEELAATALGGPGPGASLQELEAADVSRLARDVLQSEVRCERASRCFAYTLCGSLFIGLAVTAAFALRAFSELTGSP